MEEIVLDKKRLTMNDIAKIAGVGKSTVSRYFNGGYVKEETKQKIKAVINQYNYQPNLTAKMMKAKKSKIIGVVAPTLDSVTSSRMIMAMDEYLRHNGYSTIIFNTNHQLNREIKSLEQLNHFNIDGVILLATNLTMAHQRIISKTQIPIVVLAQQMEGVVSIVNDDYQAGYDLAKYVTAKGHTDITYFGVSAADVAVGVNRRRGIADGLYDNNVKRYGYVETDFSFDQALIKARDFLKKKQRGLIICATDNIALACFKEIQTLGLKIPEDISLVGFGGYEVSSLLSPSLTTIRFENEEAGCMAAKSIIDLVDDLEVEPVQRVGYVLIEGGSVKDIS